MIKKLNNQTMGQEIQKDPFAPQELSSAEDVACLTIPCVRVQY